MSKTIIQNKLYHKLQAHARMCEKNVEENKDCRVKYFMVKGSTLEGCRRTVTIPIQAKFTTRIIHKHKGISTVSITVSNNICLRLVLAVVTETSIKKLGLAGS